ncbi:MAG: GtrA family protein [Muribaculaceae bacterium]|nr:GtrA family protein [Muribaculaceae bacterium]
MSNEQEIGKVTGTPGSNAAQDRIFRVKDKILHNDGFFFTLLRSSVSSQICGWIDTLIAFISFSLFHLTPFLSTAIGAFIGGILNCIINYKYTFHAKGVEWRIALFKYIFVWTGSLLLNSFGTQILYYWVHDWHWLEHAVGDIAKDGIFLATRLFVALMVSIVWNFLLQREFVFKTTPLDPYIGRLLDRVGIHEFHKPGALKNRKQHYGDTQE